MSPRRGQTTLEVILLVMIIAAGFASLAVMLERGVVSVFRYQRGVMAAGLP